ncbi:MAG: alanine racemase, partial [Alphaproteobacteria bacterium]|nr:alanine racemase [Alphaproteobacteria bacterium]
MIGADIASLDTPRLLVDLDVMERNIARVAAECGRHGVAWRPHTKGIKLPAIAHKLLRAGAIGVTCAKLGEAEVMAAAGVQSILIANQVVGAEKIARLVHLQKHAEVIACVDSPANIAAIAAAAQAAGVEQPLLIGVFFEAVLAQGPPWDDQERIIREALKSVNDFVGYRPIPVL